jgi:outer membrane immunogenic protein
MFIGHRPKGEPRLAAARSQINPYPLTILAILAPGDGWSVAKSSHTAEIVGDSGVERDYALRRHMRSVVSIVYQRLDNEGAFSMKKLLLASVSAFALAGAAYGADMTPAPVFKAPPPPLANWAGFYVGIDGGVTRHEGSFNDLTGFANTAINGGSTFATSKTGGLIGGHVGYNFQDRSFVYGVEADISWVGAKATETWGALSSSSRFISQSQDIPWLATFRLRAGIDFESTLFYFTGGLAVGQVTDSFNAFCGAFPCNGAPAGAMFAGLSEDTTRLGWTVGAGVEHMFPSHWTVRGEFRYVDLGRTSVTCTGLATGPCAAANPNTYRGEFSNTLMSGLVGLGYKF